MIQPFFNAETKKKNNYYKQKKIKKIIFDIVYINKKAQHNDNRVK